MALRGTLADMGVVDLIQFPHHAHRSGALLVSSPAGTARLYYRKGKLVHAQLGEAEGQAALVHLVDWTEGEFEFDPGQQSERVSIDTDLHRALMNALKTRDEHRQAEQERREAEQARMRQAVGPAAGALQDMAASNEAVLYACITDESGAPLAEAHGHKPCADADRLRNAARAFAAGYPRAGLRRAFAEDDEGTVAMARLPGGLLLVVVMVKSASLGAVSLLLGKIAARLSMPAA